MVRGELLERAKTWGRFRFTPRVGDCGIQGTGACVAVVGVGGSRIRRKQS